MNDEIPRAIYLILLIMLVASSLFARRLPLGQVARMSLAWIAIFGGVLALVAFRHEFWVLGQRIKSEATGAAIVTGEEIRIPKSEDGHFWVEASLNGHKAPFLVDSGASFTTVSAETARAAGLEPDLRVDMVETANGTVLMRKASANSLAVGSIERPGLSVSINERDGTNVLGMNFLSSLASWRVEGNTLVLRA
ncbi:MAG TPA: TIGR02281 family clan AA aspartic protease [Sphingomicrobium sp.]|nr:TIGR02281 family clan AA aspartic protease [Sphingomicrobium sp.]